MGHGPRDTDAEAEAASPQEPGDFVWRFRLDEVPHEPVNEDPLLEMIRVQWEELLKLCVPYAGEQPVRVDGFALMRDEGRIHAIFTDDPRNASDASRGPAAG